MSKRIRDVRGAKSQREFAQLLGVDQNTVSKWERGVARPGHKYVAAIARLAGEPVSWFYEHDGDGGPTPSPTELINRRLDRLEKLVHELHTRLDGLPGA